MKRINGEKVARDKEREKLDRDREKLDKDKQARTERSIATMFRIMSENQC